MLTAALPTPSRAADAPADTVSIPRLSAPEAILAFERSDGVFIDVRQAPQRSLGHVRGDVFIPLDQLESRLGDLPTDRRLVFYCSCPAEELALEAARYVLAQRGGRVAVLVGGFDAWRASGGPTDADASWEETFRLASAPLEWGKVPADPSRCQYALDHAVFAVGKASGRIACRPDPAARGFAGYLQKLDAAPLRGREVTLTARVRWEAVERGAFLWVGAEDASGHLVSMTRPEPERLLTGAGAWKSVQVTDVVPTDAMKVLVGVSLMTSGRVWIDDVQLVAPAAGTLPRVRAAIANAGFER